MLSNIDKERIECQFSTFCKIVLYHAKCSYLKTKGIQRAKEISIDYLYEKWQFEPHSTDEYFVAHDKPTAFSVVGQSVIVDSEKLASALLCLSEKRREIILLSYYLRYTDMQIAALFGQARSTINYQKNVALKQLQKEMERTDDEK